MKGPTVSPEIRRLVDKARQLGFAVEFCDVVATSRYPSLLPLQGITDGERKVIRVKALGNSRQKIAAILCHELEHAEGADRGTEYPEFG